MSGSKSILLEIRGVGHVPSFKNRKRISGRRLVLDKKIAKRMQALTRAIESALRSAFQTDGAETQTVHYLPSWIALSIPLDDSVVWVPRMEVSVEYVAKGSEGADILIEEIPE